MGALKSFMKKNREEIRIKLTIVWCYDVVTVLSRDISF